MARRVIWTETAWQDVERTAKYIAEDSPGYAAAFVERIRDHSRRLDELSFRGRMVPELGAKDVRELFVDGYRLIYEVHERVVYVLGVIHGARDLSAMWDR